MGIKYLNRILRSQCSDAIQETHLWNLRNKKIAVDISIYMYRFKTEDALIENIYLMVSLFKLYKITPIFVFDGKPPEEKYPEIRARKDLKKRSEENYHKLIESLDECDDPYIRQEIITNIDKEKRNFVRLTKQDLQDVKDLFDAYGMTYVIADGEADELCVKLVKKKMVYGCLSEDMDMFVYGCDRVYRYLSLLNNTLIVYDMKKILEILDLTQTQFREICVLSGTDYNNGIDNIYMALKIHKRYIKSKETIDFYKWLEREKYIDDYPKLLSTYLMFDIKHAPIQENVKKIQFVNKRVQKSELREILKKDGFIFSDERF